MKSAGTENQPHIHLCGCFRETQVIATLSFAMDFIDIDSNADPASPVFCAEERGSLFNQHLMQCRSFCLRKMADESRWIRIADYRNIAIADSAAIGTTSEFRKAKLICIALSCQT